MPYAILQAVKYASEQQGCDVIIDHGNLTDGTYSPLDEQLSIKTAHRVVLVTNMNCLVETTDVISVLVEGRNSDRPGRNPMSIGIVLNSARSEQRRIAQERLNPFQIIGLIQPIDHLKPENTVDGVASLRTVPRDVQKAIIDRCGNMLGHLGYSDLARYFNGRSSVPTYKKSRKGIIRVLADIFSKD